MNKNGQSIIEYAVIATIVTLGILFMGPYVLRSINAHFKLWDESTQDSFHEKITQAPINEISNIANSCSCSNSNGACGASAVGGTGSCTASQRIVNHLCNPVGCDGEASTSCTNDPTCCTVYAPSNTCGQVPIPTNWTDSTNDANNIPAGTPPPKTTDCYMGQMIWQTPCSNSPIQCNPDPKDCPIQCRGTVPPTATLCPNTTSGLGQDYVYTSLTNAAACSSTTKCQYYNPPPYIAGLTFGTTSYNNCRSTNKLTTWDEGADYGPWGWTLQTNTGQITYGSGIKPQYLPVLQLRMSDGTIQTAGLANYSSGSTLPGDWSHIYYASMQISQVIYNTNVIPSGSPPGGDYLMLDTDPSYPFQIGMDWNDTKQGGEVCWDMCVRVYTNPPSQYNTTC